MQDRGLSWYDQNLNMQPRMAESWEINDDASEWTFHLREGMKLVGRHGFHHRGDPLVVGGGRDQHDDLTQHWRHVGLRTRAHADGA